MLDLHSSKKDRTAPRQRACTRKGVEPGRREPPVAREARVPRHTPATENASGPSPVGIGVRLNTGAAACSSGGGQSGHQEAGDARAPQGPVRTPGNARVCQQIRRRHDDDSHPTVVTVGLMWGGAWVYIPRLDALGVPRPPHRAQPVMTWSSKKARTSWQFGSWGSDDHDES